jgi:hypothetical protein
VSDGGPVGVTFDNSPPDGMHSPPCRKPSPRSRSWSPRRLQGSGQQPETLSPIARDSVPRPCKRLLRLTVIVLMDRLLNGFSGPPRCRSLSRRLLPE